MVPEGWQTSLLDDAARRRSGHTPDKTNPHYWNGGIKWVSLADSSQLDDGEILSTDKEISSDGLANSSAVLLPKGTVVLSRDAGVGKSAILGDQMAVSQHFIAWTCDQESRLDNWFLYYWMQMKKPLFERMAVGSTIKTIGLPFFKKLNIVHPPLAEQRKIADILSTWDAAIEKTEALLATARTQKRALMQSLLTGKRRFPEFEGQPWKEVRLGDIFDERSERGGDDLPLLAITGGRGVIPQSETDRRDTSREDKSNYKQIHPGDIGYNSMRMWQGVSALSSLSGLISPAYTVVVPRSDICPNFAKHLFKLPKQIHLFRRYSQGLTSDTWNLKFKQFAEVPAGIPKIQEQQQIASVLDTVDQDIEEISQEAEKLRTEKKALMQQLLTGKRRVSL